MKSHTYAILANHTIAVESFQAGWSNNIDHR